MTTREQVEDYRRDLDALVVLLLAELVREWTAAGLPILPGVGRARESQSARRARRGLQEVAAGGVVLGAAAAATAGRSSTTSSSSAAASSAAGAAAAGAALSSSDVVAATQGLLDTVPAVIADYQSASAALGADFFDDARTDAGIRGRFRATPADLRDDARQEILVRWATQPLRPANMPTDADLLLADDQVAVPDLDAALQRLIGGSFRQALEPARRTVADAAGLDPAKARWVREAKPDACAFCRVMATRTLTGETTASDYGGVYHSAQTAGGLLADGTQLPGSAHYHDRCDCIAVPAWPEAPYEAPDYVQTWTDSYYAAREATDYGDLRQVLSSMRAATGAR